VLPRLGFCAAISWGASKVLPPLLFAGKGPCGMPPLWLPDRSTHGVLGRESFWRLGGFSLECCVATLERGGRSAVGGTLERPAGGRGT
jgi:hypothetical protein